MMLPSTVGQENTETSHIETLGNQTANAIKSLALEINIRSKQFIDEESEKISRWAEDQTQALEQELHDIKRRIKEKERSFNTESDTLKRLDIQKDIQSLQRQMKQKRQSLFTLEDEIDERRKQLILQIEASMNQSIEQENLFTINWTII
jgi:hypothetical protein